MVQLFALEVNLRPAKMPGQALGVVQRTGPANVIALEVGQLAEESRIGLGRFIFGRQIIDQRHQGFGNKLATKAAKQAPGIGAATERRHDGLLQPVQDAAILTRWLAIKSDKIGTTCQENSHVWPATCLR